MRRPRRIVAACAVACLAIAAGVAVAVDEPEPDWAGQRGGRFAAPAEDLGTPCGTCDDPAISSYFGLAFRGEEMWLVARDGTLYRTAGCQVLQTITIRGFRGFATDLAWDSRRDVFLVTDPELDELLVVRPDGSVLTTYPSPGTGPIGAAYDTTRDVFWVGDWEADAIYTVDAATGAADAGFTVPEGNRISGLGYDPVRDLVYYNGRNERTCYALNAASRQVDASFALPGGGLENGQGVDVSPDGHVWIHVAELRAVHCFEADPLTPVRPTRWGELKRRYLR